MSIYSTTTSLALVMVGVDFSATNMSTLGAKAIDQSEAEINKYISQRYDLTTAYFQTTTAVPPTVRMWAEQLSEGYMWRWMSRGSKEALARGQSMIDGVLKNLQGVADGKMNLYDTTGSAIPESGTSSFRVQCNTTGYTETFAEDGDMAQAVDTDKLNDISNSRD